jgi:hypothetical protein
LIDLKRIEGKDTFGHCIKKSKKEEYRLFVQKWNDKCLFELEKIKENE